jgi:hypothetical protein
MKIKKRRTEITVETEEIIAVRHTNQVAGLSCSVCGGPLVTVVDAVRTAGVSSRVIHRRAEAGKLHFAETPPGLLLVCLASLAAPEDKTLAANP